MIRHASVEDAESIALLHIASWRATYQAELPAEFLAGLDSADRTKRWRARIRGNETVVFVGLENGQVVGFCACGPTRDQDLDPAMTWEIFALHVLPDLKGTGIGRRLFDEAVAASRASHASTLTLWVVRTNRRAREFYERRGMSLDGATQAHILVPGAELDEVRYRLALG